MGLEIESGPLKGQFQEKGIVIGILDEEDLQGAIGGFHAHNFNAAGCRAPGRVK
jgi:hypothetical protein